MEPCAAASSRSCLVVRRAAARILILAAALAASTGIDLPAAWAASSPTSTSLTITSAGSGVTSVISGAVVTLTATVLSGSTPVNPGQVQFCDATAAHCEDSALLATAQLTTAGVANYKFRPGIGSHSYKAVFVGTGDYAKSSSSASDLTVNLSGKLSTTTAISSSGVIGNYTLAAAVIGSVGSALSPTGEVSFLDTTNHNALLGNGTLGPHAWNESFTTSSLPIPDPGGNPFIVTTVGDFNGDGIPDVAMLDTTSAPGILAVALGNGDGTFTTKWTANEGVFPNYIAVGDFNGDGIPDLVISCMDSSSLIVLLGNGDGSFTTKSTPNAGDLPASIVVGDFNGDGVPDLAVANDLTAQNYVDSTVIVLLGNGDGTFSIKSSPTVGMGVNSVTVGDFNGDGILDLATANYYDGTLSVLLGNGDGTFTTKSTPNAGYYPSEIVAGDFNGDGALDLAVANQVGSTLTVLLGNGDGTFHTGFTTGVGLGPAAISEGDFNGDGITDLATANYFGDSVTILLGNGDGTFTTEASPGAGNSPLSLAVADLDGNGTLDLVTSETAVLNESTETATATLNNVSVQGGAIHQVAASYPGDSYYSSSISDTTPILAAKMSSTLSLSSNLNPSYSGETVTVTASLAPYNVGDLTTDGESVIFSRGRTAIGTGTLSGGVAILNVGSLPIGTDTLTASYPGDGNFLSASSNSVVQNVQSLTATPAFNPPSGPVPGPLKITITDTFANATIYYTTDGSMPSTASSVYSGPVPITVNMNNQYAHVQAIAVSPNYGPSAVGDAWYTYMSGVAQPIINPPSGTYTSSQSVTIMDATPGATIYYTTDGSVPNRSSSIFSSTSSPIVVDSTETIKSIAALPGDLNSPEAVANYNIIPPYAAAPTFTVESGFYNSTQMVSINDSTAGAIIYYTTNDTIPTTSSPRYTGGIITITSTERLEAIAVAPNYSQSAVAIGTYYIATAQPHISPAGGTYSGPQMATITDATPGVVLYYTIDGTLPSRTSPTLSSGGSILVSSSITIKVLAVAPGYTTSPEAVARFTITP